MITFGILGSRHFGDLNAQTPDPNIQLLVVIFSVVSLLGLFLIWWLSVSHGSKVADFISQGKLGESTLVFFLKMFCYLVFCLLAFMIGMAVLKVVVDGGLQPVPINSDKG